MVGSGNLQTSQSQQIHVTSPRFSINASYEYISPYDAEKDKKNRRDADGRVITQPPNIMASPQSKIHYQQNKQFKHHPQPPATPPKVNKSVEVEDKKDAWRGGNPPKAVFVSHYKTYFDADITKQASNKPTLKKVVSHDAPFRGSCTSPNKPFNKLHYQEEGVTARKGKVMQESSNKEQFK